jgi:hypothetical protein
MYASEQQPAASRNISRLAGIDQSCHMQTKTLRLVLKAFCSLANIARVEQMTEKRNHSELEELSIDRDKPALCKRAETTQYLSQNRQECYALEGTLTGLSRLEFNHENRIIFLPLADTFVCVLLNIQRICGGIA